MKEYATLVVTDVSDQYSWPIFSRQESRQESRQVHSDIGIGQQSMIENLCRQGWEVIDASVLPKLSMHDYSPRYAFILERTINET